MTRESVHVGDHERLAPGGGRAADPLAERNPHARGLALEGSEDELLAAEEVEAAPVDAVERPGQEAGGVGEIRERVRLSVEERNQRLFEDAIPFRPGNVGIDLDLEHRRHLTRRLSDA